MGKKLMKGGAILGAGCVMFQFGGCLGGDAVRFILTDLALSAAGEFVLDNDAVFDLFQDDFGTGTQYDDRFVADPTRSEPDDASQAIVDTLVGR
ncbi:MAG: hypothetical protein ACE5GE_09890 [Phycisphaerae bacterium]